MGRARLFEREAERSAPRVRGAIEETTKKKWNRVVAPKDEELDRIVAMVHKLVGSGVDVYLNVNNHYEGSAPLTIERVRERLSKAGEV